MPVELDEPLALKETFRGAFPAAVDEEITAVGGEAACCGVSVPVPLGVTKVKGVDFGLSVPFVNTAANVKLVLSADRDTKQSTVVLLAP